MARLKILIFLFALAIAVSCVGVAWWFYTRQIARDQEVSLEIKKISGDKKAPPDPGLRRFDLAVETMKGGETDEGRDALAGVAYLGEGRPRQLDVNQGVVVRTRLCCGHAGHLSSRG